MNVYETYIYFGICDIKYSNVYLDGILLLNVLNFDEI